MQRNDEEPLSLIYLDDLNRKLDELLRVQKELLLYQTPLKATWRFPNPYQFLQVNAGQRREVYNFNVERQHSGRKVALITKIGNDWFQNTTLLFRIDGHTRRLQRQVMPTNDPITVNMVAEKLITWTVINDDAVNHIYGILTDGYLIEKEPWEHLKEIREETVSELGEINKLR